MWVRLTLIGVLAAAFPASADVCPGAGERPALLRSDPARLLPCAQSRAGADRVWGAHALGALGRRDEAAVLLRSAASLPALTAMRTVLLEDAARNLLAAGRPREGLRDVTPLHPTRAWLKADLASLRADLLMASGNASGARQQAHESIRLGQTSAESEWLLVARASLALRDAKGFQAALRTLEIDYPGTAAAVAAVALCGTGCTPPALGASEEARRWSRWIVRGGASGVASECPSVLASLRPADPGLPAARLECGRALATTHNPAAQRVLGEAASSAATRAPALLALARILGRANEPGPVEATCTRLAESGRSDELAECEFLAAFIHSQIGDHAGARTGFQKVMDAFPGHPRAADAAWFAAFDVLHSPEAPAAFDRLVSLARDPADRARALYWRGRVVAEKDEERARRDWQEATRIDPFGYYGWLSALRVTTPGRFGDAKACVAPPSKPAHPPRDAMLAQLLLETGYSREAALEIAETRPGRGADAMAWADFLAGADEWRRVLDVGVTQSGPPAWPATPDRKRALQAAYPRAFPGALSSQATDVDPCLVLALMRRESRFDPDAVSPAEAVGLLQLLPKTAGNLAHELGEPTPDPAQLHDPELNIRLASRYVFHLLERFRSPLLAAAAYNAGPASVAAWLKTNGGLPIDEWVERIPFRETRAYVKAVGGAYATYWLLYGGERPLLDWKPLGPAGDGIDY